MKILDAVRQRHLDTECKKNIREYERLVIVLQELVENGDEKPAKKDHVNGVKSPLVANS